MINFIFEIVNPFSSRFSGLFNKGGQIGRIKAWELNAYRTNTIFLVSSSLTVKGDHAGFKLHVGVLSFELELRIYDIRHWDWKNDRWE